MTNWEELFEEIRGDRQLGATQLYQKSLIILKRAAATGLVSSRADLGGLIQSLQRAQTNMAPFPYLCGKLAALSLKDDDDLGTSLSKLVDELSRAATLACERIATNFERLNLHPTAIMLHSNSGTVRELVRQCISTETTIYISEARPEMEGLLLAGELVIEGFVVKTFVDDARAEVLKHVDLVIIGSDWVTEKDFTNKIGTHSLALLAREFSKKVYVAADATKFANSRFRGAVATAGKSETFYQDLLFEQTPNNLITAFITDHGMLLPDEVRFQAETINL